MKHTRETINAKLRAHNTRRGTLQEVFDEIKAFFEELRQFRQTIHKKKEYAFFTWQDLIKEILGELQ